MPVHGAWRQWQHRSLKDGGGGALEVVVVGASCRAATATTASRAAVKVCSSLRRRAMTRMQGASLGSLKGGHLVGEMLL
jgi:hypothetical protein